MTDEKQIEEMAKVLCKMKGCKECKLVGKCLAYNSADILYNAGYRKLHKNAVVLTKEDLRQRVRARTKEIFNKIFALHGNRADIMYFEIEELAKQYGVEVEE